MLAALAAVVVVVSAATPFKAGSVGVSVTGLPPERSEFYSEFVAQQMQSAGLSVVTQKQIGALLGMERQKQLLGCSDGSSCVAELAGALGVDGVLQGEAAKLESGGFQVTLKVLWSRDGRPLTNFTGRAPDEGGLLDAMGKGARLMAKDLTEGDWVRLTTAPTSHEISPSSPVRVVGLATAGVGAGAMVVGVISFVASGDVARRLRDDTFLSVGEAQAVGREGSTLQGLGLGLMAGGAAAVLGGVIMALFGGPLGDLRASLMPLRDGGVLVFGGLFP